MISSNKTYNRSKVLIVGAGPAGLSAAITLKKREPQMEVVVLDKAAHCGNHTLSGAVMEAEPLERLLDGAVENWRESDEAKQVLGRKVAHDQVLFFAGRKMAMSMMPAIKTAKLLRLGFGQMIHQGDYIVSVSRLTQWLGKVAESLGVEVLHGFAVKDIDYDTASQLATGVQVVEQGLDKQGHKQPNYVPSETINADVIVLAEGCDGLVTEKFIVQAGLQRDAQQLFSVGVKELIEVSDQQYVAFGDDRVVHAMGYPIWTPILGPGMFGGGIMYAFGENRIAVGMIVGADWSYCDFNPQDALTNFKNHAFVQRYIAGGQVVEAGAKMIPEGGYYAIPRDPQTGEIGKNNVLIVGDSAGFVNMLKIKGLHNAIDSGIMAGEAVADSQDDLSNAATGRYTKLWEESNVKKEMYSSRNFRQTVAKLGNSVGMPLSTLGGLLPHFKIERDYTHMKEKRYKFKPAKEFDKDGFTAKALVEHREEQPSHCLLSDPGLCVQCAQRFGRPCVTFCPAGVYEVIQGELKAANPSNCVHCKTCQNKCPYDNLRWTVPEGAGGPQYKNM